MPRIAGTGADVYGRPAAVRLGGEVAMVAELHDPPGPIEGSNVGVDPPDVALWQAEPDVGPREIQGKPSPGDSARSHHGLQALPGVVQTAPPEPPVNFAAEYGLTVVLVHLDVDRVTRGALQVGILILKGGGQVLGEWTDPEVDPVALGRPQRAQVEAEHGPISREVHHVI